jgi:transposase InsO family protein
VNLAGVTVPLPRHWPKHVNSSLLQVIALAHFAIVSVRSWCVNSPIARVRLAGEFERLTAEVAMLREELRIKDARMARIAPSHRPHFPPVERLAILQLMMARGWSACRAAQRMMVTPTTIASWLRRRDDPDLVSTPVPVNRFPEFVTLAVQQLRALCPHMGKVRLANMLARAGLHLGATTVGRMLERAPPASDASVPAATSGRTVTAKYPIHVWNVDLSLMPTSDGFRAPWLPFSLPVRWPFCWWIAVVVDHFSRRTIGFAVFRKEPSSEQMTEVLECAVQRVGQAPKHIVTDRGIQFRQSYVDWCRRRCIKPRFGAVGKHGSIALIERFIRSMKDEYLRRMLVPLSQIAMRAALSRYFLWYDTCRPHKSLGGATPAEVWNGEVPANESGRLEPRARYPDRAPCAAPRIPVARRCLALKVKVEFLEGDPNLPVVEIREAA